MTATPVVSQHSDSKPTVERPQDPPTGSRKNRPPIRVSTPFVRKGMHKWLRSMLGGKGFDIAHVDQILDALADDVIEFARLLDAVNEERYARMRSQGRVRPGKPCVNGFDVTRALEERRKKGKAPASDAVPQIPLSGDEPVAVHG